MKLDALLNGIDYQLQQGNLNECEITGLCEDSRKIKNGDLFFCRTGAHTTGKKYLRQALFNGAAAVICDHYDEESKNIVSSQKSICVIETTVSEKTQARLASNFYDFPQEKLLLIGVTGTKGKTTVCAMLQKLFSDHRIRVASVGTNGFFLDGKERISNHTTPELFELYSDLAEAVQAGCTHFLIEVSSLGVKQGRIAGLSFELGIFTNLYPDHIGGNEHASFQEYAYWKKHFFDVCKRVLLNRDDPFSFEIAANKNGVCSWYSASVCADGYASDIQHIAKDGLYQTFLWHWQSEAAKQMILPLPGLCNVQNAVAALSAFCLLTPTNFQTDSCLAANRSSDSTSDSCESVASETFSQLTFQNLYICGRFEVVGRFHGGLILIDYAHNEVSLKNLLLALRDYHPARIICLFGCGGNRSRVRRAAMGRVSSELADLTVITQDNSRNESFEKILADILSGITEQGNYVVIKDRREAICYCMEQMRSGDLFVLAGKGHEKTQEIAGKVEEFSERAIVEEMIHRSHHCDKNDQRSCSHDKMKSL